MPTDPAWPPGLISLASCGGNWAKYCDTIYAEFRRDFVTARGQFLGKHVGISKRMIEGKEAAFWHCISEGKIEEERVPDMRRCERIRWPRGLINAVGTDRVLWWKERDGSTCRGYVALPDFSYLVVMEEAATHFLLVTAYAIERSHAQKKLGKRHADATEKG
jgi:hypothetical protein